MLAEIYTSDLTDTDRARLAFLRATNRLWALADPAGAKALIEDASRTTPPRARSFIDAFLTVYWAAMGKPEAARESSKNVGRDELPDVVARMTAWALTVAAGDVGRTTEAVAAAEAGICRNHAASPRGAGAPAYRERRSGRRTPVRRRG